MNGRTKGDIPWLLTCKGDSTVGYFIRNSNLFKKVDNLNVPEFCPLLSDAHSPVKMHFEFAIPKIIYNHCTKEPEIKLWGKSKAEDFLKNINMVEIDNIPTKLNDMRNDNNFTQINADRIVSEINSLVLKTSKTSWIY